MTGCLVILERSETTSPCGLFRYRLYRSWVDLLGEDRSALFVMLNPSTANGSVDDPTVRRLIGFGRRWGCCELAVVNLYALRATDPDDLRRFEGDPIGPENDRHIRQSALLAANSGARIVCAWGALDHWQRRRADEVLAILREATDEVEVFGWTGGGAEQPRHPLYLPRGQRTQAWRIGDEG